MTETQPAQPQASEAIHNLPIRLAVDELSPRANRMMNALDTASRDTALDPALLDVVRTRASQINGCGYCVDMHSTDLANADVSARKINTIAVWRESPFFDDRERAALELTELMTRLPDGPVTDEAWARVAEHFTEQELADLVWVITVINAWNRLGATTHLWPLE